MDRFIGIDIGAETIKVVELSQSGGGLRWTRREIVEHHKEPAAALRALLERWDWPAVRSAAVAGRLSRQLDLPRIPTKQAQATAHRFLHSNGSSGPATVVSIGSHGFSVLELREGGLELFRENSRCSQGTGNFLRQLIERFDMTLEEASSLVTGVADPAPLSGRCPVILKTDMTHLANKGESRARILAGLFDAVCENVQVLIKPRLTPPRVVLVGGVARAPRVQENFRRFLARHQMQLLPLSGDDCLYYEALGCAVLASERIVAIPALDDLVRPPAVTELDRLPALSSFLAQVTRMPPLAAPRLSDDDRRELILGFDIGSTGSKAVALDMATREMVWEGYIKTNGNPVGAAQTLMRQFVDGPAARFPVLAVGATGSGREIVGSLMANCYGAKPVFVLNEIAAHAEGAQHFNADVDTIFEIGGQDAKYIRLAGGRVIDAAMNEACSAGTGSFIEEQGRKFSGIEDVVQLGGEALRAAGGVSLGQHCSVFMAEIIDEAVAAGEEQGTIIAGIYDSIIQNYLNRVKGSRSVGQVIFCQGMPFAADALAAAVARQTGSRVIVPPNPGTVGALGISLLTLKNLPDDLRQPLDPQRFLGARVERKDTFNCNSVQGCGGSGNKCRIDRITTVVGGEKLRFTWGGGCSLWDKGTRKRKLPDLAPDPFREREEMIARLVERVTVPRNRKRVALTDEFSLKSMFPFFATFVHELGFDIEVHTGADQTALKRGIEAANVPFCAPMQQYHGLVAKMAETRPDFIFMPMIRSMPRQRDEQSSNICPIVQASPDMMRLDLGESASRIVSPVVNVGPDNLVSEKFVESCRQIALSLGVTEERRWRAAHSRGCEEQERFDAACLELGRQALAYCREREIVPVVVLGRTYTIYNKVLNSNVPAILREQGAIGIPVDCYPIDTNIPVFQDMFWGYGQRNLRAAHQIRRTPGVYSLYCSNYSCGPDSFSLHFYGYIMEGKPFAIIETDGHSGDAGTKTRAEAFLYCVQEDLRAARATKRQNLLKSIELDKAGLPDIRKRRERLLVPRMGAGAETLAAVLRGSGAEVECLPMPDRETVRIGRRHTSGKECVPMVMTMGALLQRLEKDADSDEQFAFFMPTAKGPCRFGVYNVLHKITLERLGWDKRVRVWSPDNGDYFEGMSSGYQAVVFAALVAADVLLEALHDVRPVETRKGAALEIYRRYKAELDRHAEEEARADTTVPTVLLQAASGRMFGMADILERASVEFAAIKSDRQVPTVAVVGEIYVRLDPFSNDFVIDKLEQRGIRAKLAPFTEWLEYTDFHHKKEGITSGVMAGISSTVQARIQEYLTGIMGRALAWERRTSVQDSVHAASHYVRRELDGEAVLTVGGPVHEWREGHIDAVVSVGPLECMPNKVSESQFFHAAQKEGLLSLTLQLNGDPLDPEILDNFAFEVHTRFRKRLEQESTETTSPIDRLLERGRKSLVDLGKTAARRLPAAPRRLPVIQNWVDRMNGPERRN